MRRGTYTKVAKDMTAKVTDMEDAIAKAYKKISDGIPSLRKHKAFHDELEKMIRTAMEADAIANSEFLLEYARSAG